MLSQQLHVQLKGCGQILARAHTQYPLTWNPTYATVVGCPLLRGFECIEVYGDTLICNYQLYILQMHAVEGCPLSAGFHYYTYDNKNYAPRTSNFLRRTTSELQARRTLTIPIFHCQTWTHKHWLESDETANIRAARNNGVSSQLEKSRKYSYWWWYGRIILFNNWMISTVKRNTDIMIKITPAARMKCSSLLWISAKIK